MYEDSLVYTFTLNYNPQPMGDSQVVRTSKAAVFVECHYPRYVYYKKSCGNGHTNK